MTKQGAGAAPAAVEKAWQRQHLRVPSGHGQVYSRPDWSQSAALTARNQQLFQSFNPCLQGRTLQKLREWSRREVLAAAGKYTSTLRGEAVESPESLDCPLIVGGHQPALFHPGVWVKNFAVGQLAREVQGIGLHLIVDNDTMSNSRLTIPAGSLEEPSYGTIAFDLDRPTMPWEEAKILDPVLFASFGQRLGDALRPWRLNPLAATHWSDAVGGAQRSGLLSEAFTSLRHRLERQWGLQNLELPFSRLCTLDPFLWFASHILANLPRFQAVHNQVLAEYRRINRIRSRTHPVADLAESDGWYESPFWVWRQGERVRGRLMARQQGRELLLSDGRDEIARLRLTPESEACCAVEALREFPNRGIRLRTRALTTTLFARLCLGDTFIHGVGGAKYDEMTDRIATRFYGITAPEFLTVSATLHLPLASPYNVTAEDEMRLRSLLRDLRYNAARHLTRGVDAATDELIASHQALARQQQSDHDELSLVGTHRERHRRRAERCQQLRQLREKLARLTEGQQEAVSAELRSVRMHRAANRVLKSREYSFALFPEGLLRSAFERFPNAM